MLPNISQNVAEQVQVVSGHIDFINLKNLGMLQTEIYRADRSRVFINFSSQEKRQVRNDS
jgi:hypothetical protein